MRTIFTEIDKNKIIEYYLTDKLSLSRIANIFNCSKTPITKLLSENGILRKGRSNGKKIELTDEQKIGIKNLYLNEYKNIYEISEATGLKSSFIDKFLNNSGYRRKKNISNSIGLVRRYRGINYKEYLDTVDSFYRYELEVLRITRQQPIEQLKYFNKRGNSGVDGAYQLDHKYSIIEGFKNGINPDVIGNIKNLEFIPWEDNLKKRTKCSITISELNN